MRTKGQKKTIAFLLIALAVISMSVSASNAAVKVRHFKINALYTGSISLAWTATSVTTNYLRGVGTGQTLGLNKLTGIGVSGTNSRCSSIFGAGVVSDGANQLKLAFEPSAKECKIAMAAPTVVEVDGTAKILEGSGIYQGASGTLRFTGNFPIMSMTPGTKETDQLTVTLFGKFTAA